MTNDTLPELLTEIEKLEIDLPCSKGICISMYKN